MTTTITAQLAETVTELGAADVSDAAAELVRQAFLDCVGCAAAGAATPDAAISADWVRSLGGSEEATLFAAGGGAAPAPLAALANGTAAHALDLDDFSPTMNHPSVCLVPALLALAEQRGASGADVALAYVAGFEVIARICRALNPAHYARGWHATSTVGALGVAAAAARLSGLHARGVAVALGIAASTAGGLRQNFGTMVKPFHAGAAGFQGVSAAQLAARGFTASTEILDGPRGFFAVYAGAVPARLDPQAFTLAAPLELDRSGIAFKRFACCGAIHTAIEAALELAERHGLTSGDVAAVRCAQNRMAPEILIHHVATNPTEARFCVEYSVAAALVDGDAGAAQYAPERIADPAIQELASRVEVFVDADLPVGAGDGDPATFPAVVSIETRSGDRFVARRDSPRGRAADPFAWDDIERKFRACAAPRLGPDAIDAVIGAVAGLPALDDAGAIARAFAPALAGGRVR